MLARFRYWCSIVCILACVGNSYGDAAPSFTSPKLDGGRMKLSESLKQGPVILHFWDTCCPGCREALPTIDSLTQRYSGKITVFALSTDAPKSQSKIKPLVRSKGYQFQVLLDDQMEVRKLFGGTESPLTLLIAPSGEIILRRVGASSDDFKVLSEAIDTLLSPEKP